MAQDASRQGFGVQFCGNCLVALSAMALFFLLLAWLVGGEQFKDSLFGNFYIGLLLAGIAGGILLSRLSKRWQRH